MKKDGRYTVGHRLNVVHGHAANTNKSPEYIAYQNAKARCSRESHPQYADYGGRGINMMFDAFEEFFAEVGPRPSPNHQIDRINNGRGYEPGNLRWVLRKVNLANRRPAVQKPINCGRCNVTILRPTNARMKYCAPCAVAVHRDQLRERRRAARRAA